MSTENKHRTVIFYKDYFEKFFLKQRKKVKDKIVWTIELIEEKYRKQLKLWRNTKMKDKNKMTLDEFKNKHYGPKGTKRRDELEKGYENFKLGALLLEARLKKGMTQEQLAQKAGTTKSYISKIENNVKEVRLSTLQKIVHLGLGGDLDMTIRL